MALYTPSYSEVSLFLEKVKRSIEKGRVDFVPRNKNLHAIAALGIKTKHVWDEIKRLSVMNYYRGPSEDHDADRTGLIYEFGSLIDKTEVYIKLKYEERRGCVCMSFHPPDTGKPIQYPFREGKNSGKIL